MTYINASLFSQKKLDMLPKRNDTINAFHVVGSTRVNTQRRIGKMCALLKHVSSVIRILMKSRDGKTTNVLNAIESTNACIKTKDVLILNQSI